MRRRVPEIMDQPGLDEARHRQALRGLARINAVSGTARTLWRPILHLRRSLGGPRLRLLDIATGGGDVPIRLWWRAKRAGVPLDVEACDVSATALQFAEQQANRAGAAVRFFRLDALHDPVPDGYDVITSSLFFHHLDEPDVVALLWRLAAAARHLLLVSDLRRSRLGYALTWAGTRLLSRSPVVHYDGPVSATAAFTIGEMAALATQAGLTGVRIDRRWPFRFLLQWRRPQP
jgi:2-polyprenyl-3-methyl-5-hydroxy-6-metoxy-1,4-benzoquinol methylase